MFNRVLVSVGLGAVASGAVACSTNEPRKPHEATFKVSSALLAGPGSALAAGNSHTCAIVEWGSVKCWGSNGSGELGRGDTNSRGDGDNEMGDDLLFVSLGAGRTAQSVAAGVSHSCAQLDQGEVKCWGLNVGGQLGLDDAANRGWAAGQMGEHLDAVELGAGRSAQAIDAGHYDTCALLDSGQVKCWGFNLYGELGIGASDNRGDEAGEMAALASVQLGTGRTATAIAVGAFHTCALLDTDQIKCWGRNAEGQLGLGDANHRGTQAVHMGDNLPTVALGTGRSAKAISAGEYHTCALLDTDQIKCWGRNTEGQLGLGHADNRGTQAVHMGDNLPTVALGTGRTAKAISAGGLGTCALLDNDQVKCWGSGANGVLGQGNTTTLGTGPNQLGDFLPAVFLGTGRSALAVSMGQSHVCVHLDTNQPKCWGHNQSGRLGLEDADDRGDAPGEMGDDLPAVDLGALTMGNLSYVTTWVGNTWGVASPEPVMQQAHVQSSIRALAVDTAGHIFTNSTFDERQCGAAMYAADGTARQCLGNTANNLGGVAVAVNSTYVYLGQTTGTGQYGLTRRSRSNPTSGAPWPGGLDFGTLGTSFLSVSSAGHVAGIAANDTHLFVSNPFNDEIRVYDAETMQPASPPSFAVNDPGSIAVPIYNDEPDDSLWVMRAGLGEQKNIQAYTPAGTPVTNNWLILGGASIAFDKNDRLMLADPYFDQRIELYNVNTEPPTFAGSVGLPEGIYTPNPGPPGTVAFNKLVSPIAVAGAPNGNVIVGSTLTGTDLRVFNFLSQPQWSVKASLFKQTALPDPDGDGTSFYASDSRYAFDYGESNGQEWSYAGVSVQPLQYPTDPRLLNPEIRSPLAIRKLGDKKLLAITTEQMSTLAIFRIAQDTEIAIPAVVFATANHFKDVAPPNTVPFYPGQPNSSVGRWMWRDADQNGDMEPGEYQDQCETPDNGTWGFDFDEEGNVWVATEGAFIAAAADSCPPNEDRGGGIRRYVLQSATDTVPLYSRVNSDFWAPPEIFASIERIKYVTDTDTLYVSGYTFDHPKAVGTPFGQAGTELVRYDGWLAGNRTTAAWRIVLPYNPVTERVAKAFAVAGNRVFVGMFRSSSVQNIHVYEATTGAHLGQLVPGSEVGNDMGWLDIAVPLHALKRPDGEYVVSVEDIIGGKSIVYRGSMAPP